MPPVAFEAIGDAGKDDRQPNVIDRIGAGQERGLDRPESTSL
jgi:hypothetical protein